MIPKKPVSMNDVATALNMSISTVSRALRGKPGVAAATRDTVLAEAASLGYEMAAGPADGAVRRVCVLLPDVDSWYYSSVLAGAEEALRADHIQVCLACLPTAEDRHAFFSRSPVADLADGVIAVSFPLDERVAARWQSGTHPLPMVTVSAKYPGVPSVTVDDHKAGVQAVNQLLRSGHRRIALIRTVDREGDSWEADHARSAGYRTALEAAGIAPEPELTVKAPWGLDGGADAMERLLSLDDPPTAVFCFSDEVAIGALSTLRRTGVAVPEAMSLIAVDDHPMAALTGP